MKTSRFAALLGVAFLSGWTFQVFNCFGQGPLTPPGAPTPTMKSLDQIEARTPISSVPFTISAPGSYYLTNNVTVASGDAITINASGVMLDLNGFTISSNASSATGTAILISGATNIFIRNGSVKSGVTVSGGNFTGSGFVNGVNYISSLANARVSGLQVWGVLGQGIYVGGSNSNVVESCTVQVAGGYGIYASVVRDSTATSTGFGIVADEISNCDASVVSYNNAINANHVAQNCSGTSISGYGIVGDVVQNCYGQSINGTGLSGYTVQNCHAVSNIGTALNGIAITNCYASNSSGPNAAITGVTMQTCYGYNTGGAAIVATYTVDNCVGYSSTGGVAIYGKNVFNSYAVGATSGVIIGIEAEVVQNCTANLATNGTGISVIGNASNCHVFNSGSNNTVSGIVAAAGSAVRNCDVHFTTNGITAENECLIEGNSLDYNTVGIHVAGSDCRIDGNRINSPPGSNAFVFDGAPNLIIRNAVRENGTNPFVFNVSGNHYGPLVNVTGATDISAVTHGSDPWANFIY